ncbi:MAG: hypothetical protein IJ397_06100 [Lachnospiraceae bacterium]|nr:hypothetical protein [Lachnospiraceae bacterium]
MNINNYNYAGNMSMLFQSLYTTNNSGSSSMASLTNSILGGSSSASGIYSSLSDYSLIKSGSYGKLLKAYYADEDLSKDSKAVTSNDIYEKLKAANNPKTEEADKTVTETEDGKVIEKTEATNNTTDSANETDAQSNKVAKKDYDVLEDLLSRNRTVGYTNSGNSVKDSVVSSYNYAV